MIPAGFDAFCWKDINNINWLVKSHPHEEVKKVITSTVSEYEKICSNYDNIKINPNNITMASIPKLIDVSIPSPFSRHSRRV